MRTPASYEQTSTWRQREALFPAAMRLRHPPRETWVKIEPFVVHLDVHGPDKAPATVVLLHGGGGNGRLLASYGQAAAAAGFRAVAPDLPGFGLTRLPDKRALVFQDWRRVASEIAAREATTTGKLVVVAGLSMGGMLAWDTAALTGAVASVVATCLLDPSRPEVQRSLLRRPWMARPTRALFQMRPIWDRTIVPMAWVSNMAHISNDPAVTHSIAHDRLAGGTWMPGCWLRTYAESTPVVDPADFDFCPVTLAHPADDRWTTPELSTSFLRTLTRVPTRFELLTNAGHLPLEEPGRSRLEGLIVEALQAVA